jgi:membrane protease subunit HflK
MTGDTNILSLKLMFQYTVVDLPKYLYRYEGAQFLMAMIAEAALTEALGAMGVEDALTSGRVIVQNEVRDRVQDRLEELDLGIAVSSVNLLSVDPPSQIIDVFRDVSNAAADRERIINDATGYANSVIPRARGEASWIVERANADRDSRISEARGQTARFLSVLEEYRKIPDVTRTRLYLETLETVLPNVKRYVVDPGQEKRFDLKILDLGGPTAK